MAKPSTEIYINGEPVRQPQALPENKWGSNLEFLMQELQNRFGIEVRDQFGNLGIVEFAEKIFGIPPQDTINTLNHAMASAQQEAQQARIQAHADAIARDIGLLRKTQRPTLIQIAKTGFNNGFNNK